MPDLDTAAPAALDAEWDALDGPLDAEVAGELEDIKQGKGTPAEPDAAPAKPKVEKIEKTEARDIKEYVREGRRFVAKPAADAATDTTTAPDATAATAETVATELAAGELPPPEPFVMRVRGEDVDIPGAQYVKGYGLFVPEANLSDVRSILGRGMKHDDMVQANASLRGDIQGYQREAELQKAVSDLILPVIGVDWLINLGVDPARADMEIRQMALAIKERRLDIASQFGAQAAPTAAEPDAGDLAEQVDRVVEAARAQPDLQDLFRDPKVGPELEAALREELPQFRVAWKDIPERERRGLDPQVQYMDVRKAEARVKTLVERFRKFTTTSPTTRSAQSVAKANAAAVGATTTARSASPPAATAVASTTQPAMPSKGRKPPAPFKGTTPKELAASVDRWWAGDDDDE